MSTGTVLGQDVVLAEEAQSSCDSRVAMVFPYREAKKSFRASKASLRSVSNSPMSRWNSSLTVLSSSIRRSVHSPEPPPITDETVGDST